MAPVVHLASDHTARTVDEQLRRQRWRRIGHGAYVPRPTDEETVDDGELALARVIGVDRQLQGAHAFSHVSAAIVWGLPTYKAPTRTHVRVASRPGSRRDPAVRRHLGAWDEHHLRSVALASPGGRPPVVLPVTSLELTVVDCLRVAHPMEGLVIADGGLRRGADLEEMRRPLAAAAGGRGAHTARQVLALADAGAESAGESVTRFLVLRDGLPVPQTQIRVDTRIGTFWADLGWEEWVTLLEYDGRPKYRTAEDLIREKRRHDAVVETGRHVLRVTREDVFAVPSVPDRLRRWLPRDVPITPRPELRAPWFDVW